MNAVLAVHVLTLLLMVTGSFRYHVATFSDTQSGLYYESVGALKVQTKEVNLITYLDLTKYNQNAKSLNAQVNASLEFCNYFNKPIPRQYAAENDSSALSLFDRCIFMNNQTKLSLSTIDQQTELIFKDIDDSRAKRGISFKYLGQAARLIFGSCSDICVETTDKIITQTLSGQNGVFPALTKAFGLPQIWSEQPLIDTLKNVAPRDNNKTACDLDRIRLGNTVTLEVLLNNFLQESNTLFEILRSAKLGHIHLSLIDTEEILTQIKGIAYQFDTSTELPYPLSLENIPKLIRLSKLAIYYSNDRIVFKIGVPLTYYETLDIFHILPLPICIKYNCVLIKPNSKYIAITPSRKLYSTFERIDQVDCQQTDEFTLCPEQYPLHLNSSEPLCETLLFQDLSTAPPTCNISFNQLSTTIFYKLTNQNKWYYISDGDTLYVTCNNETESSRINIINIGILTLNETCKATSGQEVLLPIALREHKKYNDYMTYVTLHEAKYLNSSLAYQIVDPFQSRITSISDFLITGKTLTQLQWKQSLLGALTNYDFLYDYIIFIMCSMNLLLLCIIVYIYCIIWPRNPLRRTRRQILASPEEVELRARDLFTYI